MRLKFHHYMYGIVFIIIGLISQTYIFFIGLGLFVDELPLIMRYGDNFHYKEYWSQYSIISLIALTILIALIIETI